MRRLRNPTRTTTEPDRIDDRGVTEVLAFILVFATILGSVGLLYMTGFQAISDYQANEQLTNAERAMDSLADNFNDVVRYDGVDQRYSELTLRGGTIKTGGENTTVSVGTDWNGNYSGGGSYENVSLGALEYELDADAVAYESGGVFRASGDDSTVLKQPRLRCGDDTAIVSLIALDHPDERRIQSTEGVGFTITKERTRTLTTEVAHIDAEPADNVTIVIDSPRYQTGWERALERAGWQEPDDGVYSCGADRIEIRVVEATIDY